MLEIIRNKPFLVAILSGAGAQLLKVLSFLIIEKKVKYRRFVQPDGSPNLHSAAFSALTLSLGIREGFSSLAFAFALCLTSIIVVDTMNVKNATSRQTEAVWVVMNRLRGKRGVPHHPAQRHSYTPMDVISGLIFGSVFTWLIF